MTRETAKALEDKGVSEVYVKIETEYGESECKVMTNGMVDIAAFIDFDVSDCGNQ